MTFFVCFLLLISFAKNVVDRAEVAGAETKWERGEGKKALAEEQRGIDTQVPDEAVGSK